MQTPREGWVWSHHQVWVTRDGGQQWTQVTPPLTTHAALAVDIVSATAAWILQTAPSIQGQAALWYTANQGRRWQRELAPAPGPIGHVYFVNHRVGYELGGVTIAAGQETFMLWRTLNGGHSWHPVTGRIPAHAVKSGLVWQTPQRGWVAGGSVILGKLWLYQTVTGGRRWTPVSIALPHGARSRLLWSDPPQFFPSGQGILPIQWNGTGGPIRFYHSNDGGQTWRQPSVPVPSPTTGTVLAWSWASPQHGAVLALSPTVASPTLFVTRDGGMRWQHLGHLPFGPEIRSLNWLSGHVGWILTRHHGIPQIWRTNDGGIHWVLMPPPSRKPPLPTS